MKNFEYWKDKIFENVDIDNLALVNGMPESCEDSKCKECGFYESQINCAKAKIRWLYEEHIERPTLTKKERLFCELMEAGWIARDNDGKVFWHSKKPKKALCAWDFGGKAYYLPWLNESLKFEFIKWDDKEPWSVEELLKLGVRD